jgi:hypothetical protein
MQFVKQPPDLIAFDLHTKIVIKMPIDEYFILRQSTVLQNIIKANQMRNRITLTF